MTKEENIEYFRLFRKVVSAMEKMSDDQVEDLAELIFGLIQILRSSLFYQYVAETSLKMLEDDIKVKQTHGRIELMFMDPKEYLEKTNYYTNIGDFVDKVCKAHDIDPAVMKDLLTAYITKKRLVFPNKYLKLKRSEYRDKVKIVTGNRKDNSSETKTSIYLQIFSDTTQTAIRRFVSENDLLISQLSSKAGRYPVAGKYKNLRKEILCLLYQMEGYSYSQIVEKISKTYDYEKSFDEGNVATGVRKLKKLLDLALQSKQI